MPKVLVTGVNGFVGHHLVHELRGFGCQVYGAGLQPGASSDLAPFLDKYYSVDLTDATQVDQLSLNEVDAVISLAGLAKVGDSFKNPDLYMKVNTAVVSNISAALIRQAKKHVRHLVISTGAVYDSKQKPPFSEESGLAREESPYVLSKIAMEDENRKFREQGLDLVIARPFNHIGPGQEPGFLLPDLAEQVRHAVSDGTPVRVGNLETKRDYTDVRDVVKAYRLLALADELKFPVYNVCSGRSVAGHKILELVLSNVNGPHPEVVVDKDKFRPSDAPDIYGDNTRLSKETGWSPSIPLEQTIKDCVNPRGRRDPAGQISPISSTT